MCATFILNELSDNLMRECITITQCVILLSLSTATRMTAAAVGGAAEGRIIWCVVAGWWGGGGLGGWVGCEATLRHYLSEGSPEGEPKRA